MTTTTEKQTPAIIMENLILGLDFENIDQYFEYMFDSHLNGNLNLCKELYNNMPKQYKGQFVQHCDSLAEGNLTEEIKWYRVNCFYIHFMDKNRY